MARPNFANIPLELRKRDQWVLWKTITRAGKPTKVPYRPAGIEADSSDPASWSPYKAVVETYQKGGYDGVGYVFDALDPYAGVDLDDCINPDGSIKPKAKAICDSLDSYSEISPSGKGIKIFLKAKNPVNIQKKDGKFQQGFNSKKPDLEIEIYYGNRFFTLTGNRIDDYPPTIEDHNSTLNVLFKSLFRDRGYFKEDQEAHQSEPTSERSRSRKTLSPDAVERFQLLLNADPNFASDFTAPAPVGKRSDVEFNLCARLWEAGFDEADIYAIMTSSPQTKWLERDDNYRWETIRKAVAKSEASHKPHIFTLPTDTEQIPAGTIGVDPLFGNVKKVVKIDSDDGTSKKFLAWVSDCAVFIQSETRAGDAAEFMFEGVGAIDRRAVKFALPAVVAADARKFRAACVNAFGAKNRFGELGFEMVQQLSQYPRVVERVEVPAWKGNVPLVPGVNLADKIEFRLSSKIPASVYDGDLPAAKEVLKKLLMVHKFAPILVAAILGSPAIARWRKNDRFGLGLWGGTGTLKTSTSLAALGIYGIGYLDGPKLKAGKAGSTTVGAMEVFAAAGFLPQIYDDVKTVDSKDSAAYVATVHAVLEGEEKARGKKDGGLRDGREFLCTPVITGEVRPSEASTSARIFNLNWTRSDDKLLSEVQQNAALLPVIGYHWLRFLASTNFVLGKDFDAFRSRKMEEFLGLKYTNPGRLATIYSLLVSVWDLLEASPVGDVFTEARESFKAALQDATATQGLTVTEETEISRFLNGLEELIAGNPGLIMSNEGKKVIAGAIIGKKTDLGLFLLPTQTLNELAKIRAFNQQPTIDSITQALNEMGVLIRGEDRLMARLRIGGDRVYGWMIKWPASVKDAPSPPTEDGKNDSEKPFVPTVPVSPVEKRDICLRGDTQKNRDRLDRVTHDDNNGGDSGDNEDSSIVNSLVDSDYNSKVSVPDGVLSNKGEGTQSVDCGKEQPTRGAAPHPRKDEPTPGNFVCHLTKLRAAAIMEYGMAGWDDPIKLSQAVGLPVCLIMRGLDHLGYERYERASGGVGYRQQVAEA